MRIQSLGFGSLAALVLVLGGGCKKSASEGNQAQSQITSPPAPATLAQVHWLGKKRLAAETNAATFLSLWNLPQSVKLETQTLDKLALAIAGAGQSAAASARLLGTNQAALATNYHALVARHPAAARVRPLLDDLVREECYLEIQQVTNQPVELALAIRLDDPRAGLWISNLSAVVGALTNVQSLPAVSNQLAWRLPLPAQPPSSLHHSATPPLPSPPPSRLELRRAGDWTLLGLARESNTPLDQFADRIQRDHTPVPATGARAQLPAAPVGLKAPPAAGSQPPTFWLEAALSLQRLAGALALGPQPPAALPKLFLAVAGHETNVLTHLDLEFPKPLPLEMEAWTIPTNLIHDPLIGFSALRGIRPWLQSFQPWQDLQLGTPPNQAFFWAQGGPPSLHFLAAPAPQASNQVRQLSELVLRDLNPILVTNGWPLSGFASRTNSPGLVWRGIPYFSPCLDYADCDGNRFLVAGLAPDHLTNQPAPAALFEYLEAGQKLVAYDWENTRTCLEGWTQMGQLSRHMLCLPRMTYTAGFVWLAALSPKLGKSETAVELASPTRLSSLRTSTLGLTGAELHLLADWLESLEFPRGLHTFTAPPPPPPPSPGTNAPPLLPRTNAPAHPAAPRPPPPPNHK